MLDPGSFHAVGVSLNKLVLCRQPMPLHKSLHRTKARFPRSPFVGNRVNRGPYPLTDSLYAVMFFVGEVAAKNFAPNVGHLRGERSQWCNRLPRREGGIALKRIIKVLAIAVVMTALILAMVAPAFAQQGFGG